MTGGEAVKKFAEKSGASEEALHQFAALCYRVKPDKGVEVLLITSRDTGRWVLPKGWPIKGKTPAQSAEREAFEEAGAKGKVCDDGIGLYTYAKGLANGLTVDCVVTVFPMRVKELATKFPESGQRQLKWFTPVKAAGKVAEPELAALLAAFDPGQLPQPGA